MIYTYTIEEIKIGVGDRIRDVKVRADRPQDATKALRRYLESCYEDKVTFTPYDGYFKASLQRNAGHLIIRLHPNPEVETNLGQNSY